MYAGMVHFSVKSGSLDEAVQAWREGAPPAAEGQPGYKGALLLVEPGKNTMVGIGLGLTRFRGPIRVKRSGSVKGVEEDGQDRQAVSA